MDEADRLFDMGFLKQVDEIITACTHKKIVRSLFSATIPLGVEHMASTFLRIDHVTIQVGSKYTGASTIDQRLQYCGNEKGKILALKELFRKGINPPVLIFAKNIRQVTRIYKEFQFDDLSIDFIHGKRDEKEV
jgi:ATP-dependent RNA helicase DDX52/ROK1